MDMDRQREAESSLNVPVGVSGEPRRTYLALTDDQKRTYRYHWFVMGQPAWACLAAATTGEKSQEDTG